MAHNLTQICPIMQREYLTFLVSPQRPASIGLGRGGLVSQPVFFMDNIIVTCSAILALLDKDDDLRARHELLNTERIL